MLHENEMKEISRANMVKAYNEELRENLGLVSNTGTISEFIYELMLDCLTINDYMNLRNNSDIKILNDTFVDILESHTEVMNRYDLSPQMISHFMLYTIKKLRRHTSDQSYEQRIYKFTDDCTWTLKATGTDFIKDYCESLVHSGQFNNNNLLNWINVLQTVRISVYFRYEKPMQNKISSEIILNIREFMSTMIIFDNSITHVLNIKELYSGYKLYTEDYSIDFNSFKDALIDIGLICKNGKYIRNVRYTKNGDMLFNFILPATKENELL